MDDELIVGELDLYDHGSVAGNGTGVVLTKFFSAQSEDDVLNVRIARAASSRLPPMLSALTLEDVTPAAKPFTGASATQGLDLDGDFVYAVNMGGTLGSTIRDATFTPDSDAGSGFSQSFSSVWNLGLRPEYGTSPEDDALEEDTIRVVRYQTGSNAEGTVQMGELKSGHRYKLQLLWHEVSGAGTDDARIMDVFVDGKLVVSDLDLHDYGSSPRNNRGVVVTAFFDADQENDVLHVRIARAASSRLPPMLSALTLEDVSPPAKPFTGAGATEGLDLDGHFVYAINMGGTIGSTIRDATFTSDSGAGSGFSQSFSKAWNQGLRPEYGASPEDDALEEDTIRVVRYQTGSSAEGTIQMRGLEPGHRYKLQLLWHEVSAAGIDNARIMDVFVGETPLLLGLDLHDFGSKPGNSIGVVATAFFDAKAEDNVLDVRIARAASSKLPPMLSALTLEDLTPSVGTFTGTGRAEGLDLDGDFVHAVNMGGTLGAKIRDADFTTDAHAGSDFSQSFSSAWKIGVKPEYGASAEDNIFEQDTMRFVRYQAGGGSEATIQLGGLKARHRYKLQLMWHEVSAAGTDDARLMDVSVDDEPILSGLDLHDHGSRPGNNIGVVYTKLFEAVTDGDVLNVRIKKSDSSRLVPMLNALTLEDLSPEDPPAPPCVAGVVMHAVLSPGALIEPCAGFMIDVPEGAVSSNTPVTFEFDPEPKGGTINDSPIFQAGLVQLIHMEPSMEFNEPLLVTLPKDLLGSQSNGNNYLAFLVDEVREPQTEIEAMMGSTVQFTVPHFSQQAIFDWSSMATEAQTDLWDWTAAFYTTPPPRPIPGATKPLGPSIYSESRGVNDGCVPTVNGVHWNAIGNGVTAGLHARHGRDRTEKIDGIDIIQCMHVEFDESFSGSVFVRARQNHHACGEALYCSGTAEQCATPIHFWVFHSSVHDYNNSNYTNNLYKKVGDKQALTTEFETFHYRVPATSRHVLVCRENVGGHFSPVQIDAIMTDPSPCPPASTGERACDDLCSASNIAPACGCTAQWQARARLRVGRKPAFWPTKYDVDKAALKDFYDHSGTDVYYEERLLCTPESGAAAYLNKSTQFSENGNHGGVPNDEDMDLIGFEVTGWEDVPGPYGVQRESPALEPADRWFGAASCECASNFAPNPVVPGGFEDPIFPIGSIIAAVDLASPIHATYPASVTGDGGHVCNDDTFLQIQAFRTGVCEFDHATCTDNVSAFVAPIP